MLETQPKEQTTTPPASPKATYRLNPNKAGEVQVREGKKWKAFKTFHGPSASKDAAHTLELLRSGEYRF